MTHCRSRTKNLKCNSLSYFLLDKKTKNSDVKILSSVYHCEKLLLKKSRQAK